MNFSYDRAWADVVTMVRANFALLATLAGVFLFLPAFALWLFAPLPQAPGGGDGNEAVRMIYNYYIGHWPAFLALTLVSSFGQAAILALLLDRNHPTVGEALTVAGRILPGYFLVGMLTNLAIAFGFMLLIVPGLFLVGRLAVAGPTMIGERIGNPVTAIQRSWAYTTGLGWRIAGLVLLVGIVGWIALSAASSVIGVVGGLLLPDGAKILAAATADALGGAGLALLLVLLSAAVYRQLRGGSAPLQDVFS